ncbi:hypothetical protein [Natrinema ejinorense]|uniref:hypothetical protein n=1 Tax=Natrinema ejinorense TaxID=373386 RepID=UPI001472AB69|nr:hypothetical protein [Natrinema ejinorense]
MLVAGLTTQPGRRFFHRDDDGGSMSEKELFGLLLVAIAILMAVTGFVLVLN